MGDIESILETMRKHVGDFETLGARIIGVFGSTARGEPGDAIDLDNLVSFRPERQDRG